ncbi:DUF1592 domain-containing protein [Tautonia rosea]|uniref:DUF1592 domain-containing protein n=1 Tax=Tautonia rosea TaxID=2728037 RepID=UPI0014733760|nr:DUF1592 domain-containing protein [Tautonia rosea]
MGRREPGWGVLAAFVIAVAATGCGRVAAAEDTVVRDESFFVEQVYPMLHTVQCERCHTDNGVASDTLLEFPGEDPNELQIVAFGLSMIDLVDREDPRQSLLLTKPTRRTEHTGGRRIRPDSEDEQLLLSWVNYLAGLSDDQVREARETIARSEVRELEPLTVRRLTHSQYNHTVSDLLGDQSQPANRFPKEDFINGFKNQLEAQGISPLQAEAYGKAAERLALAAFRGGDHQGLIPRTPESPTDAEAAGEFVRQFGLKAFRRPLTADEVARYCDLFLEEAGRAQDFERGASMVIETMLQSPYFLFRVERGANGPDADYEMASRLSYLLWDTMPSDELFQAAAAGELSSPGQIEAAARRMLDDPRARSALDEFLAQWLRFDRVLDATKDRRRFRQYNAEVAAAMVEETRRLFNDLVWNDRDFRAIFTADYTFINADLAQLYELPMPEEEFGKVAYPAESGRSGVLGHGSFLVATSNPAETSPTARGLFVRNHFLGQEVPPPPAGVSTDLPVVTEAAPMTNRERLAIHLNSESCASCHRLIDPIGLGFENYDAIGAYEETMRLQFGRGRGNASQEGGPTTIELEIDPSGYIQGIENSEFSTPKELGRLLAESETSQRAIVKQFFRYAFGRQETVNDEPVLDGLYEAFRDSGFRFRELIVALITSELFLQKGTE